MAIKPLTKNKPIGRTHCPPRKVQIGQAGAESGLPVEAADKPSANQLKQAPPLVIELSDESDASITELFISRYGSNHRFITNEGYWINWQHGNWQVVAKGQEVMNDLENLRALIAARRNSIATSVSDSVIRKLSSDNSKRAILRFLQQHEELSCLSHELDSHNHLLACNNAVINLSNDQVITGEVQIRSLMLTKRLPVDYNERAECPKWIAFLNRIFGNDADLISFVQKAVSCSLSGEVREERLYFAYGTGANGKSTLFEVLRQVFGNYSCEINPSVLTQSKLDRSAENGYIKATLLGARFAATNEIQEHSSFNDMEVKQLSSRDPITCRKPYGNPMTFIPSHKLWVRSNHKPYFNITDSALLRRIVLIPFAVTIPHAEQIQRYEDTLLKEKSGILNWLLEGWGKYRIEGLTPPEACNMAMREYMAECDILGRFIEENCARDSQSKILLRDFSASYNSWAEENGCRHLSSTTIAEQLRLKGYEVKNSAGNRMTIFGMRFSEQSEETQKETGSGQEPQNRLPAPDDFQLFTGQDVAPEQVQYAVTS